MTHNHVEVILGNGDGKLHDVVGMGALKLNNWNRMRLALIGNEGAFALSINDKVVFNVEQDCGITIAELKRAKFTFGEDNASNNFNALLRNFQVSQISDEEARSASNVEEVKTEQQEGTDSLLANADEFFFIQSLYEMALFEPKDFEMHRSRVPYKPRTTPRRGKVVICHDLPGGICEEKFT